MPSDRKLRCPECGSDEFYRYEIHPKIVNIIRVEDGSLIDNVVAEDLGYPLYAKTDTRYRNKFCYKCWICEKRIKPEESLV